MTANQADTEADKADVIIDTGDDDPAIRGKSPMRRCLATREIRAKPEMIRFVVGPDAELVPDLRNRLPGRGLWVTATEAAIGDAVKRKLFARAAKGSVRVDPDLLSRVREQAVREAADLVGLARKGGQLVTGFEKVLAALQGGKVALLISACDAAPDGQRKLAHAAGSGVEIWAPLPGALLAQALGREIAVHAAVRPGGMSERLRQAFRRVELLGAVPAMSGQDADIGTGTAGTDVEM